MKAEELRERVGSEGVVFAAEENFVLEQVRMENEFLRQELEALVRNKCGRWIRQGPRLSRSYGTGRPC